MHQFAISSPMIDAPNCLSQISCITDHIYLSGIGALDNDSDILKKHGIKYILCCVNKKIVDEIHNRLITSDPNLTILYIPYDDIIYQNLWHINNNQIQHVQNILDTDSYNKTIGQLKMYHGKTMIEIGYHFIDTVVSNGENILVHCMAGVSRSASVVIYYLMKKFHLSWERAKEIVRSKRHIINPNASFQMQLKMYENLRDKMSHQTGLTVIHYIKQNK